MPGVLLEQKNTIEQFLEKTDCHLSVFSFLNIFAWADFFEFEVTAIDNHLCIFAKNEIGVFLYLPPLGRAIEGPVIDRCFDKMYEANGANGVSRIDNVGDEHLKYFPVDKYTIYKKSSEYVYDKNDIVVFEGNDYKSKRSSYNQFTRHYRYAYIAYEPSMLDECMELYAAWARQRTALNHDVVYTQMIEDNDKVHRRVLANYGALGLIGRVVKVDGQIKGYTFGFPITKDSFCVLFEITDLTIKGLSVFIFRSFCAESVWGHYKYVNVMDDFEMENIKKTKMSFHPSRIMPIYTVTQKENHG